jgi:NADH:ubiquinone oxidoreductase subunit 4 (subunit M)
VLGIVLLMMIEDRGSYLVAGLCLFTVTFLTRFFGFICYELITVVMVWWVSIGSSSFERGSAVGYILWYSFVIGFLLIANLELSMIALVICLIGYSKLPTFGLHQWLPKVHVEANMFRSILLAGLILKVRLLFCSLFAGRLLIFVCGIVIAGYIMSRADGKVVMAYSSVAHMTVCGFLLRFIRFVVGITHVVISPIMFLMVYVSYNIRRSRILGSSLTSGIVGLVLLLNLGFPIVGAFMAEIYLVICLSGLSMLFFVIAFFLMGIIHMKMFHPLKGNMNMEVMMWLILLVLLY